MLNDLSGIRVLVVDDRPDNVRVASKVLKYLNAEIYTANNGQEAYDVALVSNPHIIISDIDMPIKDGWQLLKDIRATPRLENVPVIALTASNDGPSMAEECLAAGFCCFMTKPISIDKFRADVMRIANENSYSMR